MASIYKRLIWGRTERISSQKLNDMISNDDYLFEKLFSGYYNHNGLVKDTGLTFRAGSVSIPNFNGVYMSVNTFYSRPFLPGTKPIILLGLMSSDSNRIHYATRGLDGSWQPDHTGFNLYTSSNEVPNNGTEYKGTQYMAYLAIGPTT